MYGVVWNDVVGGVEFDREGDIFLCDFGVYGGDCFV